MKLALVHTEFPKLTETFALRDAICFHELGNEIRLYHLTRFRSDEPVHAFAAATLSWARGVPYLSPRVVWTTLRVAVGRPARFLGILAALVGGMWRAPTWLLRSLAILPKCCAIAVELERWGADHLHAQFATHPATCGWVVHRLTGIPYSVSCHAHDIFVTQALLDRKLGEASFVRVVSDYNRRFLLERVPDLVGQRFLLSRVGVDPEAVRPLPRTEEGVFRLLYVGSLQQRKGVHLLLDALAQAQDELGDWSLDLVGEGPMRSELERMADRLGLASRIRFHGPQPYERVVQSFEACQLLVVPSTVGPGGRTEGIPTVLVEALAHGRPVLTTRVSGIPELVEDGVTGFLVEHGSAEALAAGLVRIRRDPDLAWRTAAAGRARVEAEYDQPKNARAQAESFARNVVGGR
ncbi:MAG: glycosyltransferase family 4 protein [Deltaproteobacteria bacterium]|nr:glycosyltransferase family 4 protein [Deltaproteobacteria bacterium]